MIRNLLFISLLCWMGCCSCSSLRSGCRAVGEQQISGESWKGIVDSRVGVNKYNLTIDAGKKNFSGLLLVKQMEAGDFRMVFTTHFGMRVFDFGFTADSLSVHYCIPPLNREKIFRFFRHDFTPLLGFADREPQTVIVYHKKKDPSTEVWELPGSVYYLFRNHRIRQITAGRGWGKTSWTFEDYQGDWPSAVRIRHACWPIRLKLERL